MSGGRVGRAVLPWMALAAVAFLGGCGSDGGATTPPTPLPSPTPPPGPPNIILILADDLGWGDLSSFGHPLIRTPNIDRLAAEGARLESFYTPASVCAPARAALMTGRYPIRVGVPWNPPERLNEGELTVADLLHEQGYFTAIVGKWHLGWGPPDMPVHHGFDSYYGKPNQNFYFVRDDQPTSDAVPPELVTWRYTQEAVKVIHENRERPFFLYLAHHAPHEPLAASDTFLGTSEAGLYGDVIAELDWGVGEVLKALEDTGLDRSTLVVFTSDNGPVVPLGSAGPFQGAKGWPTEGGVRVPALVRWPSHVPAGRVITQAASLLDFLPTAVALAGGSLPTDRTFDGEDISRLLTGEVDRIAGPGIDGGREVIFWLGRNAVGIRSGKWKYLYAGFWNPRAALYDLEADPGESADLKDSYPVFETQLTNRIAEIIRSW